MIGQTLSHYQILEKLGAGGMGEVDKAHERMLWAPMAVQGKPVELAKVMTTSYSLNST